MNRARFWNFVNVALPFSLLILLPSVAFAGDVGVCASTVSGEGILSGLALQFQTATASWGTTALGYARDLFFSLVAIEMAWSAVTYILQKDSLPDFIAALALKLLSVGFFFILLQPDYGPAWINDVITSFMQAGSAIGGQTVFGPTDPSAIFNCGTDIAGAMMASLSERGFTLNLLGVLEAYLTALLCALGVTIAFAVVAGQLLVTLIESYIVIGGGLFFLGFTGSRWTLVFGEKYLGYIFSVGIKLFMLELIVGLGYNMGRQWAALFTLTSVPPGTYIEVVGAALVFGFVAWQIPGLAAASLMNGAPRMTLGGLLNNLGTTMVGGVMVGSSIAGLAAGASTLVGKGLEALRNAASVGASTAASSGGAASGAGHYDDVDADFTISPPRLGVSPEEDKSGDGSVPPGGTGSGNGGGAEVRDADDASDAHPDGSEKKNDAPSSELASEHDASDAAEAAGVGDEIADDVAPSSTTASDATQTGDASAQGGATQGNASREQTRSSSDTTATSGVADETVADDSTTRSRTSGTMSSPADNAPASDSSDGAESKKKPSKDGARKGFKGVQGFRAPPIPDDSADGSIHIRFKHPE
jgi:type IV secretion system protein TrbL